MYICRLFCDYYYTYRNKYFIYVYLLGHVPPLGYIAAYVRLSFIARYNQPCFLSERRTISPHGHGFLPRRPCISNLVVSEEVVTQMMDQDHTADVIYQGP